MKMKKTLIIVTLAALLLFALSGLAMAGVAGEYPHLNSNDTGFFDSDLNGNYNSLVRAVPGQNVHTDFQLNTNSCASCHMTHTAVGRKLLFQATISDTCFACHDGTIGVLNVLAAPTGGNQYGGSKAAGTFGGSIMNDMNPSVHNVDMMNELTVSGAPGGNKGPVADSAGLASTGWSKGFSCASCHAPHGSYSIRLLHANPNFLGWRDFNPNEATDFATGGLWSKGYELTIGAENAGVHPVSVPGTAGTAPWLFGYNSSYTLAAARTVGTHSFSAGVYNRHNTRIYATNLYDPNAAADGGGPFSTVVDGVYLLNSFFDINYKTGAISITAANKTKLDNMGAATFKIDIARALVVTAGTTPDRPVQALDYINTKTYSQLNYNRFCAACHTDYLPQGQVNISDVAAGPGTAAGRADAAPDGYGTYSAAHRHTINRAATVYGTMEVTGSNNMLLCVSCHFAHGTEERAMKLANAEFNDFDNPSMDINPSSALKRYVNQAVCFSCHANSVAGIFMNTDYYWTKYDETAYNKFKW
jgi:predicted CXXCH cytochrome family protein